MAFERELKVILSLEDRLGRPLDKSEGKLNSFGKRLKDTGASMTKWLTLPIVGFGAATLKVAGDFEKQMNRVKALTGATGKDFDDLRKLAMQLGADTEFSAKQAAEGMQFLGQAGFKVNQIMEAMPGVLDLAAASQIDIGTAADITSNILFQFGMKAKNTSKMVDLLAKTANASNQDMMDLADAFNYIGPTAKAMGISIKEVAAITGIMSNAGLKGSLGTRAFGTSLTRLAKPTNAALDIMEELNLEFFTAEGKFKSVAGIVGTLEKGFEGLTDKQKQEALATIFGAESIQEWNILLKEGSGGLKKFTKELSNNGGEAKRVADIQRKGLAGALEQLTGSVETLMIALGESGLIGIATEVVLKVTDLVNWFGSLDDGTKKLILGVLAFLAVIGPVVGALGSFITAMSTLSALIPALSGGLMALGAAGGPILGIALAAGIAVTATVALIDGLKGLRKATDELTAAEKRRQDGWKKANEAGFAGQAELQLAARTTMGLSDAQRKQIAEQVKGLSGADRTRKIAELAAGMRGDKQKTVDKRAYQSGKIGTSGHYASGGLVPKYAAGGMFIPRGTDTVPAMLTPGEAVMSRKAVDNFARGKSGNTIINIDLTGSVVSNDLLTRMVREVEKVINRKNELNILGLS